MKIVKKLLKWLAFILLIPVAYILIAFVLTYIPVNTEDETTTKSKVIYLTSNGVHLDIIIPKQHLKPELLEGLEYVQADEYFAFGWGDKKFYLETPTWNDLTFENGFQAVFLTSPTLVHATMYSNKQKYWTKIPVTQAQLSQINQYIYESFRLDADGQKIMLAHKGYFYNDKFYEALGSYSALNTCNSWVNTGFKQSGIKSCMWTPFDFKLLDLHK
jgi:uncharacterized protein (TIGR02117 family)